MEMETFGILAIMSIPLCAAVGLGLAGVLFSEEMGVEWWQMAVVSLLIVGMIIGFMGSLI